MGFVANGNNTPSNITVSSGTFFASIAMDTSLVDDQPDTEILYFSAVANGIAAKIYEKYRNYDATNSGNKRADEMTPSIDEYRRNKHWAIQQLLGKNHTVVDLI